MEPRCQSRRRTRGTDDEQVATFSRAGGAKADSSHPRMGSCSPPLVSADRPCRDLRPALAGMWRRELCLLGTATQNDRCCAYDPRLVSPEPSPSLTAALLPLFAPCHSVPREDARNGVGLFTCAEQTVGSSEHRSRGSSGDHGRGCGRLYVTNGFPQSPTRPLPAMLHSFPISASCNHEGGGG